MLRDFDDKIIKATWQPKTTNSKQRSTTVKSEKPQKDELQR